MPSYPVQTPDARWAIFSTVVDNFTHAQMTAAECREVLLERMTADDADRCMRIAQYLEPATTPFLKYSYYGECVRTIRDIHGKRAVARARKVCEGEEKTARERGRR